MGKTCCADGPVASERGIKSFRSPASAANLSGGWRIADPLFRGNRGSFRGARPAKHLLLRANAEPYAALIVGTWCGSEIEPPSPPTIRTSPGPGVSLGVGAYFIVMGCRWRVQRTKIGRPCVSVPLSPLPAPSNDDLASFTRLIAVGLPRLDLDCAGTSAGFVR
jgi:hypothetical protein